jgi:hypothetical protein
MEDPSHRFHRLLPDIRNFKSLITKKPLKVSFAKIWNKPLKEQFYTLKVYDKRDIFKHTLYSEILSRSAHF